MSHPEVLLRCDDHCLAVEPPDLLIFEVGAELDGDIAKRMVDLQADFARGKSHLLLLCRIAAFKNMDARARVAVVSRNKEMPPLAMAVVGAPFRGRVVADMLFRAIRFLGNGKTVIRLFDGEDDARVWLCDTMRRELTLLAFAGGAQS